MKTEVLASMLKSDGFYGSFGAFGSIELINMPDEISDIILNEGRSSKYDVYKKVLDDKVIKKTRSVDELTRLIKILSETKQSELLDFMVSVIMPLTFFKEDCEDKFDDMINELDYVSKIEPDKMNSLYLFYSGLNLERSSGDRLNIIDGFVPNTRSYCGLKSQIKVMNDRNIFEYRDSKEIRKMLYWVDINDEKAIELRLSIYTNPNILKNTTFDEQNEILNILNTVRDEEKDYIAKAACLLDLGSHRDNMNILLEMAAEKDIDKVKKIYAYIEQIYGEENKSDITYNSIIDQINIISPTIELCFGKEADMKKFYNTLKCNNIDSFDTNTDIYMRNDRGRVQKVKLI